LETVELARRVEEVRKLGVEGRVIVVVLDVLEHRIQLIDLKRAVGPAAALLDGKRVRGDGLFQREIDVRHITPAL
jgi:hypothetical protein